MLKLAARLLLFWLSPAFLIAQNIPPERRTDWQNAGLTAPPPIYAAIRNILDFGGKGDSLTLNDEPFIQALASLEDEPGIIDFPPGKYLFQESLSMRDSLILRGAGADQTRFYFDLGGASQHCISFQGQVEPANLSIPLLEPCIVGDSLLHLQSDLKPGDFVKLEWNDSLVIYSSWARGAAGQLFLIKDSETDHISLNHPLRISATLDQNPRLRKINPVKNAGVECIYLKRLDGEVPFTANISLDYALRCWLSGIESEQCNFGHFTLNTSAQCEIYGCYLHDAFAYGGGGQGYGVVLQSTSSDNRVQNNIFRHLRHSMLLQSGANGNVLAYNFSTEPFWEEFPNDGAGEIAIHGNYPSYNLFEGNICKNIRPDGSHGLNGPMNTLFRNRTSGYGLIFSAPQYQANYNIAGNEILQGGFLQGLYIVSGTNHLELANYQNGNIVPSNAPVTQEPSLYWTLPPKFLNETSFLIGPPANFNSGTIPARERFNSPFSKTTCDIRENIWVGVHNATATDAPLFQLFPNPATSTFVVNSQQPGHLEIFDLAGSKKWQGQIPIGQQSVFCASWPNGYYLATLRSQDGISHLWLVKGPNN
jgi:hypothetical protein